MRRLALSRRSHTRKAGPVLQDGRQQIGMEPKIRSGRCRRTRLLRGFFLARLTARRARRAVAGLTSAGNAPHLPKLALILSLSCVSRVITRLVVWASAVDSGLLHANPPRPLLLWLPRRSLLAAWIAISFLSPAVSSLSTHWMT